MESITQIVVERIHPSPRNPRKHLGDLSELVASVRKAGILQPVTVRPKNGGYELVFGHRRHAAAKEAGLTTLPAIVRDLDDDSALELGIIENSQRDDIHPLDEADGFAALIERGRSPAEIASAIGRPTTYIVQRLKLCELSKASRKALDDEQITVGVALALSRVPGKLQDKALETLLLDADRGAIEGGTTPTAKMALTLIRDEYMLRLVDAPFDRASAELVAGTPPCTVCPKRTGNQAELFTDVDSPDLCTDPTCYRAKLDAHWKIASREAKQAGRPVLAEAEAKKVFSQWDERPSYGSGYTTLDAKEYVGNKSKTVKSLVGKDVETVLARNPHTGHIHELVPKKLVEKAKQQAAPKGAKKTTSVSAAERRREREQKIRRAAIKRVIEVAEKQALLVPGDELLGLLVRTFAARIWSGTQTKILARRGIPVDKRLHVEGTIVKLARELHVKSGEGLAGLGLELVIQSCAPWHDYSHGGTSETWKDTLRALKVDFEALEKQVGAELDAKAKKAPAANGRKSEAKKTAKAKKAS